MVKILVQQQISRYNSGILQKFKLRILNIAVISMLSSQNKNLTAEKIIKTIESHKDEIRKFGVKRIGVFGSYAKKSAKKRSDIDILVSFDRPTFDNYMELKFLLEKMFRKRVDLVALDGLKPALKYVKKEALYAAGV
ncbi:Nucleotidyltransferase domain protein [uncultured archaeon]|nr:Nucleotidyltransferase domain protein [uncultured archaeon]